MNGQGSRPIRWTGLFGVATWIWRQLVKIWGQGKCSEGSSMTPDIFFWYIFPLIVAVLGFGWVIYDTRKNKQKQQPGE